MLIFMIGLILFYQVFDMLWVDSGQNLLAHLKQSSEHSKDDIWLFDCLNRLSITSSQKRDLYAGSTQIK